MKRGKETRIVWCLLICFLAIACKNRHLQGSQATGKEASGSITTTSANNAKAVKIRIPNYPLRNEQDLDVLLKEIGDAKVVLLGEASHGTHEYYTWRAAISKRLIEEKGFDFIAVEGEWADSYRVNNFIKGPRKDSTAVVQLLRQYNRWPTWMWGNYEVASLVNWLNNYNQGKEEKQKIGFFGLDVYCLWESMTELMPYLPRTEVSVQNAAQKVHQCFQPYSADGQEYALAVANASENCRAETNRLWQSIRKFTGNTGAKTEAEFVMEQNALVALNGERYYRAMTTSDNESWNIRDRHMAETLKRLMQFHGPEAKAIIWEHNTHVGDARYTDMAAAGMTNVGELARKEYGREHVFIVGFGSHSGSVIASNKWGAPYQSMTVPEAPAGSWEGILHQLSAANKIILSREIKNEKALKRPVDHRAIGVVYHPNLEHMGNYVPSVIPHRYDAFLYIDRTKALNPIPVKPKENEPPDTYPWGT